ncbi:MAG TPA: choice-of-anchor tandem repeat NxxGxxAF-containing protein [Pirellulales bacterium]|jgi:hypothetical protein
MKTLQARIRGFTTLLAFQPILSIAGLILSASSASAEVRADLNTVALSGMAAPGVSGATFADLTISGPTISPTGVVAFTAILQGSTTNGGIFTSLSPGNLSLVVLQGANAPGTSGQFLTGNTSVPINPANEIAASGLLTNNRQGIWVGHPSADTLVALSGNPAPLPGGFLFGTAPSAFSDYSPVLDWTGDVLFQTGLQNSSGQAISGAAVNWVEGGGAPPSAIARTGGPVNGYDPTASFTSLGSPGIALNSLVAYSGTFNDPAAGIVNGSGIFAGAPGIQSPVAVTGGIAQGVLNATFQTVGFRSTSTGSSVHVNVAGNTIFFGTITGPGVQQGVNDHGVWLSFGSIGFPASTLVARQGDQVPGLPAGTMFSAFTDSGLGNGSAAILAQISGPGIAAANNTGIWEGVPGNLHLFVRNGDSIADGSNAPLMVNGLSHFTMNSIGDVIAQLSDNSIIGESTAGQLMVIARPGDSIQVAPGDFRTIQSIVTVAGGETSGGATALNDMGLVTFTATFTDGSMGTFVSSALAVPEPSTVCLGALGALVLLAARRRNALARSANG